jgi:monofunctional biosynthetic peptidoglycan transglycosylase
MTILHRLKSIRTWQWASALAVLLAAVFYGSVFLGLPDVADLKSINPPLTALMERRIEQAKKEGANFTIKQEWVSFRDIPQLFKDTVRIAEDSNFYWHHGIDYEELKEAIKKNIREKRFARGASTITQQLAKNLYLSTKKSPFRKIKEYFIARKLEKGLTKDRIFELYLNVIELGPGIFGVQTASKLFFGHSVDQMSLEEIIRLTAIIPRPLQADPMGHTPWLLWRCRWLLHKLLLYKYVSEETYLETVGIFSECP